VAEFRDQRLKLVSGGTVIRELAYISSIINHARREWSINIDNPVRLYFRRRLQVLKLHFS